MKKDSSPMEVKELPCPCCNSANTAKGFRVDGHRILSNPFITVCNDCGMRGPAEAWNRRPSPTRDDIRREAFEEAAKKLDIKAAAYKLDAEQSQKQGDEKAASLGWRRMAITMGHARLIRALSPPPSAKEQP